MQSPAELAPILSQHVDYRAVDRRSRNRSSINNAYDRRHPGDSTWCRLFCCILLAIALFALLFSLYYIYNAVYVSAHYNINSLSSKRAPYLKSVSCTSCGAKHEKSLKIVGGRLARPHQWPWQVAIFRKSQKKDGGYVFVCGASLISDRFVLTAAHCLNKSNLSTNHYVLKLGGLVVESSDPDDDDEIVMAVKSIRIHRLYDESLMYYDMALLEMEESASCSSSISPVCLPEQDEELPPINTTLVAIGWGSENSESSMASVSLKEVQLPLVAEAICSSIFGAIIDYSYNFCAGYKQGGEDTCQGDSGGPIMQYERGAWTQIGITSWGDGCAKPFRPGVYTRLSTSVAWIMSHVTKVE